MPDMSLDTHAFVKTLTAAGMPEAQAEAVTTVVRESHDRWLESLVTNADFNAGIAATRADFNAGFAATRADFNTEIAGARADFRTGLAAARADFSAGLAGLRGELGESEARVKVALAETKADIMKWMIGTVGGAVIINAMTIIGAMLALTKLSGH